jgi:hypothetical protein
MTVWLGGGRFAVAGWDDGAPGSDARLLGLRVVNTRSWRARTLDPDTDYVCVAGPTHLSLTRGRQGKPARLSWWIGAVRSTN